MSRAVSIIGLIFSGILFFVAMRYNILGENTDLDPIVRSVLLFIVSLTFSESIARILAKSELKEHQARIENLLKNSIDCYLFGNSEKALEYIVSNLHKVEHVQNTHVKYGSKHEDGIYNSKLYEKYLLALRREVKNKGLIWIDVVGESSVYRKKQIIDWADEDKKNRRIITRIVPDTIPIVNHIILKYRDGSEEILFGWAYKMDRPSEPVFLSKDKDLIGYFTKYFNDLSLLDKDKPA